MATLLDVKEDRVRLRKASGEVVTVPLERLSQADQQFVKERVLPPRAAEPSRLTIRCAGPVKLVAIPPDGSVFAAAIDSEWRIDLKVWDAKTGRERATIKSREFWGNPFYAFTHDGKWLVTGRSFLLWDAKTGREQPLRVDDLEEFAWRIKVWDPWGSQVRPVRYRMIGGVPLYATPRPLGRPTSYEQLNTDLAGAYAPDGSTLAVGLSDGAIRLQDAGTRQVRATFQGHEGTVRWIAFTQDGRSLISAGDDGIIKVWDGRTRQERNRLDGFTPRWTDLQVSPNGQMIAAINERRQAICWRITDKRSTILKKDVSVYCLAICPDSKSLVLAYWDSSESHLEVMDAGTGQVLKTLIGHQGDGDFPRVSRTGEDAGLSRQGRHNQALANASQQRQCPQRGAIGKV